MNQNDLEHLEDMVQLGKMTVEQANIEMVRGNRVKVVSKLPRDVRNALNSAVKDGLLKHKGKSGYMPEIYYHPEFEYLANAKRNEEAARAIKAISSVMVPKSIMANM